MACNQKTKNEELIEEKMPYRCHISRRFNDFDGLLVKKEKIQRQRLNSCSACVS